MTKSNVEKIYGLTPMQEGMLFHSLLNEGSGEYVIQSAYLYKDMLDVNLAKQSLSLLSIKHEVLRTAFVVTKTGKMWQLILRDREIELNTCQVKEDLEIESLKRTDVSRGFNLQEDSLLRISIIHTQNQQSIILSTMHHIISDGWCISLLTKGFLDNYEKLLAGKAFDVLRKEVETEKNAIGSYQEYIQMLEKRDKEAGLQYWELLLAGYNETAVIPPIKASEAGNGVERLEVKINKKVSDKLRGFAQQEKITLNNIAEVAWGIVLQKYNQSSDVVFGKVVSGRDLPINGIERMVGLFINTVPIRVRNGKNTTIREQLKDTHQQGVESSQYDYCPLVEVQSKTELGRHLFSTLFVFENYYVDEHASAQLSSSSFSMLDGREQTNYSLCVAVYSGDVLRLNLMYDPYMYGSVEAELILKRLEMVIIEISENPDKKIADIDIVTDAEKHQLLYEFNNTFVEYPQDKAIHQLFEEQAAKAPDNVALVFGNEQLTYGELNVKANQLARLLSAKNVKSDVIVGLMVERSPLILIGILGILKAGGAYLPIDTNLPEERIKLMRTDSQIEILLTESWLNKKGTGWQEVINLDKITWNENESGNLEFPSNPSDLAYVMYTSGSTGMPKGVMVEHQSVINLLYDMEVRYPLQKVGAYLLKTPYIFDVSIPELFSGFVSGAKLVILPPEHEKLPNEIISAICDYSITHISFVPSMLNVFLEECRTLRCENYDISKKLQSLKYVLVAGEVLRKENVETFYQLFKTIRLENLYGPTEATVYGTRYTTVINEKNHSIPIGKPFNNTRVYIMNGWQLSGIGTPGELYIGGDGLARGYLNRAELTKARFISNPLISRERIYRTGDLARWLPDGNIEFLGRIDHQVKIRGFRVELGEVESQILKHHTVKEVAVLMREEKAKDKYLCAYLVSEGVISAGELRQQLSTTLPDYMIPSSFVKLEKMPLLPSGKIDRKALPEPDGKTERPYVAPRNMTEAILALIWSEVLGRERVGIYDNFFELGGHSLKATTMVSRIHKELNVMLPLKELFRLSTISEVSEYLSAAKTSVYASIEPVESKEYYEASSAQKRMWLLQQLDHENTGYNLPGVLVVNGNIDRSRLEEAFLRLIKRHESLRTMFAMEKDVIVQKVARSVDFEIEYAQGRPEAIDEHIKAFIRPFDLSKAPLLRAGLITISPDQHYLLFDMHHIIADGASMAILTQEFMAFYEGQELKEQRIGYKDFSQWQNEYLRSEKIRDQESYWLEQFSGEIPLLNLPLDYPRPTMQNFTGGNVSFKIEQELTEKLNDLAGATGTTLYMVLLSAISILLSKYTGQTDIIIGSPIAGRPHADLEGIIGMFVNTLAMRCYPVGEKTYTEFLKEIKETALTAYENQDYQFEELVEKLELARHLNRNPLFDVMFVLQNMDTRELVIEGLSFNEYSKDQLPAKFDLTFMAAEIDEGVSFNIEYRRGLFKRETIERLSLHFQNLIEVITINTEILLGDIELLSKAERDQILYEFNDKDADYPSDKTINQLFEEQVRKTPEAVALVFHESSMTYSELNREANQLAQILRKSGVKPDDIVGIMAERAPETIIGILGILKSGGAYMPIDPEYPKKRIAFMLQDSGSEILLTQSRQREGIEFAGEKIMLDGMMFNAEAAADLETVNSATDLAYVVYTSGTTGMPKGILVEHQGVIRLVRNTNYIELNQSSVIMQTGSIAFDASTFEIWGALLNGGKLVLADLDVLTNNMKMKQCIEVGNVNVMFITTALYNQLLQADPTIFIGLKFLLFGGEQHSLKHIQLFKEHEKKAKLLHVYGPTETTTFATFYEVPNDFDAVPIGRPISNTQVYIMNDHRLCGIGVPGEIWIAGSGLARGYLNQPKLTAAKFVPNPFGEGKIYRTGDLARWLSDGNIQLLGRIDHQVKIRGFRIELGEVENQIMKLDAVKESVVLAISRSQKTEAGGQINEVEDKYLCAYIASETAISISELRQQLSSVLPDYMIPSSFVWLERMPITASGKIDRKALPEPDGTIETEYVAPRNRIEKTLAQIWSEVLGREKVGIYDNFFELGGHSLKATMMASRIHQELDVELPLKKLFGAPTIAGISEYLLVAEESAYASIEPVTKKEYYGASSAQKRMWLLQQFDGKSIAYNMPGVLRVEGELDKNRLEAAFLRLIERHESLRTTFDMIDEAIIQRISETVEFEVEYMEKPEAGIEAVIAAFIRPFDLKEAPLLRVGLVKVNEDDHYLIYDMHHIISDGISMEILTREFMTFYAGEELKVPRIQYKDFSEWQNEYLQSEKVQEQERYWLEQFSETVPVLDLPLDYPRPVIQGYEGRSIKFRLGRKSTEKLNMLARKTGTTIYMILLSSIQILLSKYSGQADIIIGSPIAGRHHADLEGIIGMFVNTLAMRSYPISDKTYAEFLSEVRKTALEAYENQDYQFEELVDQLDLRRDISRNPLFDVMFELQNIEETELEIEGLRFTKYVSDHESAKFDLTFNAMEMGDEIAFSIEYNVNLFKRETIKRMSKHLCKLLNVIVEDTAIHLGEIDILSSEERNRLLNEFNDTYADYPKDKTVHELFEEQVERTPENVALVFNEERLTYSELNEKSNQLANLLRSRGVKPDTILGLMVERSFEIIIGILGILKSGGAYLPIDPDYPEERISFMLKDSQSTILLTQSWLSDKVEFEGEKIVLDDVNLYIGNAKNLDRLNRPSDLAYVIYTSGSTGKPKGVPVEHGSVVNLAVGQKKIFGMNEEDRVAQFYSISFDPFVEQMFTTFVSGASLHLLSREVLLDNSEFNKFLYNNGITHLDAVPSFLEAVNLSNLNQLKRVISSGEACPVSLFQNLDKFKCYNSYGPTETTVTSMMYLLCSDFVGSNVPIGKPILNYKAYILNSDNKLTPVGIPGELCISGNGVARGYLNRPKLMAEKFVENPFIPGERMYRTGDLARWLPDGNIEFLGRIDQQVKIRGIRIELGEIESQILKLNMIKEAVVLAREGDTGDKYLCAYLVSEEVILESELKQHLSAILPDYMIPSYFVQLEKLPLTGNGKLDRIALPEPEGGREEYVAPKNETEETLVQIWGEVLGKKKVGTHDNFFELGGHSLKAMVMVSKIHKELNVELPLKELFTTPTISGISEYLTKAQESVYASIESVGEKDYYETSSAQKRMWLLQQFDHESTGYNMPVVLMIDGKLNESRLEAAFRELIERHESLRTSFDMLDDTIIQRVDKNIEFEIDYAGGVEESIEEVIEGFIRPFDLTKAPLLRVMLVKTGEAKHCLLLDMHHIISDAVSMSILTREFMALYDKQELAPQKLHYKDFSQWQNEYLKSEKIQDQKRHWLEQFSGELPVLELPLDYARSSVHNFEGASLEFRINHELTEKLNNLAWVTGTTLYMVLISVVSILLSKYSGQDDIIIGSPIAGRPHADLEDIIGMFVNTLAIRSYPKGGKKYEEFLQEVRETALKAYENQDYQFEKLVDQLDLRRDMSRNPLFDVMFVMQNTEEAELEIEGLKFTSYVSEHVSAKFDLTLDAIEIDDEIFFNIEYSTHLFKRETIQRFSVHLLNIVKAITTDKDILLGDIDVLTKSERKKILHEFNDTYTDYPRDKTIYQLFEEQVKSSPYHVALVFENKKLTYYELNEKANRLANQLRNYGISRNDIVAILGDRSINMVIAILGVLKSGAAYMPIDPEYPTTRIEYMLDDSGAAILLVERATKDFSYSGTIISLEDPQAYASECTRIETINEPDDLAYIMYTSGSTGKPKGVMLKHRGVISLSIFYDHLLCFKENNRIVHMSNVAFDAAVIEIFPPLIYGATIFILKKEKSLALHEFHQFVRLHEIQIAAFVPITLKELLSYEPKLDSLDKVLVAGDKLDDELKDKILSKGYQLTNHYGPTETTVDSIVAVCTKEKSTIGKPIANTRVYILDAYGNPTPIRVPGEIYIAGVGVAKGYINKPELTAEKFVANPLGIKEITYKTGDIGYWEMDGTITFLGRKDNQIKLRGHRIELEEIEKQLLKHQAIEKAIIVSRQDDRGHLYLSAYFTSSITLDLTELREYLTKELPAYMVPARFTQITEIPLTSSGKVDRKSLPEDSGLILSSTKYAPPTNHQEAKLLSLWEEVLGTMGIGINHNFFDLGGNSLTAAILVSRVHKMMNVSVPFPKILEYPTIAQLSKYIENTGKSEYIAIKPIEVAPYYPTSYAQKRMYVVWMIDKQSVAYNMPVAIMLEGKIDIKKLERTVQSLVDRHEILRTSFLLIDGEPMQKVHDQLQIDISYHKLGKFSVKEKASQLIRAFDLMEAPLFRVACIEINESKQLLVFDIHHIIYDALSTNILLQDFMDLYADKDLKELRIGYKDYATWHNQYLTLERMQRLSNFWIAQFQGFYETNLPEAYPFNTPRAITGKTLTNSISGEQFQKLSRFALANEMTKFSFMLGIFKLILMRILDQDRITVGVPVAGRQHDELEDMIGVFLNTLVSTIQIDRQETFHSYILTIRDRMNAIFSHQEYPYENLLEDVRRLTDYQGNALFSIMFNYMPYQEETVFTLNNVTVTVYELDEVEPQYNLTLYVIEGEEEMYIHAVYKSSIEEHVIKNILDGFQTILDTVMDHPEKILKDVRLNPQLETIYRGDFDEEFENDDLFD